MVDELEWQSLKERRKVDKLVNIFRVRNGQPDWSLLREGLI
jgi:hypothetical protein